MKTFASLILLGYKRQQLLIACLESLIDTIDYPCEIILNDDTSDNAACLIGYLLEKRISKLVCNAGPNRGVGRSFQNALGVAEGDFIFKIDTDLTFKPGWLSQAVQVLEKHQDVAAISLFNYNNYNAEDKRFKIMDTRDDCYIVSDFVSSIYGFRREDLWRITENLPVSDDGVHQQLADNSYSTLKQKLAITKEDLVINHGFGLGKSTYVVPDEKGEPVVAKTYNLPLLFDK